MSRGAWAAFAAMALLWGMPYFFIKIAVTEVSPPVVSLTRLAIGMLVLLPVAARLGHLGPALRRWPWILYMGVFYMALPFTLIPLAELYVPSSLTAIIISGVPLMVALFSLPWETPSPVEVAGLVVGFAGVVALVGVDLSARTSLLGGAAVLLVVTALYAIGPIVVSRRLADLNPLGQTALSMCVAVAVLVVPSATELPAHPPGAQVVSAVLALGLLCTAIPFIVYYWLIREVGPRRATLVTYFNPAFAVLLGVLILRERLTVAAVLGLALILAGSWLATRGRRPRRPAPEPARG